MKKRRLPPNARLKLRYNLCHRLRLKGVVITTDASAIELNEAAYNALSKTARRYVDTLVREFGYVVQLRIPDEGSTVVTTKPANAENLVNPQAVRHLRRQH